MKSLKRCSGFNITNVNPGLIGDRRHGRPLFAFLLSPGDKVIAASTESSVTNLCKNSVTDFGLDVDVICVPWGNVEPEERLKTA